MIDYTLAKFANFAKFVFVRLAKLMVKLSSSFLFLPFFLLFGFLAQPLIWDCSSQNVQNGLKVVFRRMLLSIWDVNIKKNIFDYLSQKWRKLSVLRIVNIW